MRNGLLAVHGMGPFCSATQRLPLTFDFMPLSAALSNAMRLFQSRRGWPFMSKSRFFYRAHNRFQLIEFPCLSLS